MSNLGSIYDNDDPAGPRGRDLSASVEVPRSRLGARWVVQVALELPHDGVLVPRAIGPGEKGSNITLNLPLDVPNTLRLRLRGQGEALTGGRPGDLHLEVNIVDGDVGEQGTALRSGDLVWGLVVATALGAFLVWWAF